MIKVDGPLFECCRRWYYYGLHSYKCKQANGEEIKRQQDVETNKGDDKLRGPGKTDG